MAAIITPFAETVAPVALVIPAASRQWRLRWRVAMTFQSRLPNLIRFPLPAQCQQSRQCLFDELRFLPPSHHRQARHGKTALTSSCHATHSMAARMAQATKFAPTEFELVALTAMKRVTDMSSAGHADSGIARTGVPPRVVALGGPIRVLTSVLPELSIRLGRSDDQNEIRVDPADQS